MLSGLAVAAAIALAGAPGAQAQQLRLLSSWDTSYAPVEGVIDPLMRAFEEATGGEVTIQRFGPETIPPFEQLDPVARGAFDLLVTNGAYHYNESAAAMSLEALLADSAQLRESGIFDLVDAHYQEMGLKLLAYIYDPAGYHILLKEPLDESLFEGRRIRGTPVYHPVIEALKGSPVVLPAGEIYTALERGVVDGASWPTIGAVGFRWFEVADYMMRPTFGSTGYPVFMNLDRWTALDDDTRAAIAEAAEAFEVDAVARFAEIGRAEEAALAKEGMEATSLPEEMEPTLYGAWYEGVMALSQAQNPDLVEQIRSLAIEAELVP